MPKPLYAAQSENGLSLSNQLTWELRNIRQASATTPKTTGRDLRYPHHKTMAPSLIAVVLILTLAAGSRLTEAIWLDLPSSGTKCVSEDIQTNVVVLADYSLVNGDDTLHSPITTISAKVTSPYGNNLHHQENVTHSQFAFTTNEAGSYLACFWVHGTHQGAKDLTVSLDWRIGIAAKDWDSVAKKENIEGIEFELRKLEDLVEAIHEKIYYLKHIEAETREVSETTNARVAWLSIMSIGICIVVSVSQFFYLKRYFRKKKLI